jgi:HK97 gp10 family phage protein
VAARVEGLAQVLKRLRALGEKVARKGTQQAVAQGGKIVLWDMKGRVTVRSGLLRRSLGRKQKTFRNSGTSVSIVGPRVGFRLAVGVRTRGKNAGKVYYANPTHYAHLLEKGTRRSAARPFEGPAVEATAGRVQDAMANVLANAVADAAR